MMQLAITEVEGDFFTSRKNGGLLTGERNYSASKRNYSLECILISTTGKRDTFWHGILFAC